MPAGLLALVAVSLLGGLVGILWQWREAVTARGQLQTALRSEARQLRQAEQNLYQSRIAQASLRWESGRAAQARDLVAACLPRAGEDDLRGWEWYYLDRLFHAEARTLRLPRPVTGLAYCPSLQGSPDELAVALGQKRTGASWPVLDRPARDGPLQPDQPFPAPGPQPGEDRPAAGFLPLPGIVRGADSPAALRPVPAFSGDGIAVAVQQRGSLIAWTASGGKLLLGDRTTGQLLRTVSLPEDARALCFTPQGNLLLGGHPNLLREVNPATGEQVAEHAGFKGGTDVLAIDRSGRLLAVGSTSTGRLVICELPTFRVVKELPAQGFVTALAFSSVCPWLAAAYHTGTVSVWQVDTWQEVRRFQALAAPIHALAFHPLSYQLAIGGADHSIRLWNIVAGQLDAVYRGHDAPVLGLAYGPGDTSPECKRRDRPDTSPERQQRDRPVAGALGLCQFPPGDWLASCSRDQTVRIWDTPLTTVRNPQGQLLRCWADKKSGFVFDKPPVGLSMRAVNGEGKFEVWLLAEGRVLVQNTLPPRPSTDPVPRTAAHRPEGILLSGGRIADIPKDNPCALAIWNCDGNRPRLVLPAEGAVQAVAADPTGRWLAWAAAAGQEGVTIRCWDTTTESVAEPIRLQAALVRSLTLESSGWLIAVTSQGRSDAETVVWAIDFTGKQSPCVVLREAATLGGVAFRPDGRELAVTVGDTVHLYLVGSWELVQQFSCLAPATGLAYSPDGRRLAAASADMVTLLDPVTGKALFQLPSIGQPHGKDVSHNASVAFSPNGAWLVSTNRDGSFNVWDGSPLPDR